MSYSSSHAAESAAVNGAHPFPPGLTFIFGVTEIRPNFHVQAPRHINGVGWAPPSVKDGYEAPTPQAWYRWQEGRVTRLQTVHRGEHFKTATIFTRYPDSERFFATPLDPREANQEIYDLGGWRDLGFNYIQLPNNPQLVYSDVEIAGFERSRLPGPGAATARWIQQLFPGQYRWSENGSPTPRTTNAGLIGSLPLVPALAAFSCPPNKVDEVLRDSIQPRSWRCHAHSHGRQQHRGVVVSVYKDAHHQTTTAELKELEAGTYGPVLS